MSIDSTVLPLPPMQCARAHPTRSGRLARHYLPHGRSTAKLGATVRMAARDVGFPTGHVSVLDDENQHIITGVGLERFGIVQDDGASVAVPREATMCNFTVRRGGVLAVDDLRSDPRYATLPGVEQGLARSYLGVALHCRESDAIGTLCVSDDVARHITSRQIERMQEFARIVEDQLELMRRTRESNGTPSTAIAELVRALERDEIRPYYQPIVDLRSFEHRSYEALARWIHPTGEVEDPARFVPAAEDSDLVVDLDLAVMRHAASDLRRWLAAGREVSVNVNVSTLHLEVDGGVQAIRSTVREAGVPAERVTLELTESRRLDDPDAAREAVDELRSAGFAVVLDDFGTGWSSLDWLMTLPINGLKIDRSVTAALDSRAGQAVNRATTGLARDLDLSLILEGIGTSTHVASARAQGYRYGQGYFWSPPVPPSEIDEVRARP